MLMLADTLPIAVEILDKGDKGAGVVQAELRHLDGEAAILVAPRAHTHRLRWGTRLRFEVADDPLSYEIVGTVVASEADAETGETEILLRLWECRTISQIRSTPRRRSRFTVTFRAVGSREFRAGQCVNIGGGGMCLRIPVFEPLPERLTLQFRLPCADGGMMELQGRVVRVTQYESDEDSLEVAVCFEKLTVAQGMTIAAFLSE